jgi:hypothetical protein
MKQNKSELQMSVESKWTTSGGDGRDHHARVQVTEGQHEIQLHLRNLFDFGFQIFAFDTIVSVENDDWMNVRVEVQNEWDESQETIKQKGVVQDVEGMDENKIEFVNWEKSDLQRLEAGEEYVLESVVVDEFNEDKYLSMNSATKVRRVTDEYAEFLEDAREYARENSPIPTGIRM